MKYDKSQVVKKTFKYPDVRIKNKPNNISAYYLYEKRCIGNQHPPSSSSPSSGASYSLVSSSKLLICFLLKP